MDVVGSEIGQKMRSAIKAKLTELGCYVDDELPDYVMVMVANKRTRAQMEDDLQLFLGDNTELFVNWLHQVLKKLQEVTVTSVPLKTDIEKRKERSVSKEKKQKDKKEKTKKGEPSKKAKKKEKEKARKKEEKKAHKSKKKNKSDDIIRPNIPPLLMNLEKESEPSITDVFAGQILKNHGVILEPYKEEPKQVETKVLKRQIVPIIDLETITSTEDNINTATENKQKDTKIEQIKEMNQIEAKIQGLKQKLSEQLDSMSDDEDFLNIRTEAEELMNDLGEDVSQGSVHPPPATPPLHTRKITIPIQEIEKPKQIELETLPQIELNLPKRPIRERLGARAISKTDTRDKDKPKNPERFTPEKNFEMKQKSAKSRLGNQTESQRKSSLSDDTTEKCDTSKRLSSKVSILEGRTARSLCTSVVRVRPRPRVGAPASSLLLRAVADAHKSLLNVPPKLDTEPHKVKRALVLPMRRIEAHKIVIQVPVDTHSETQGDLSMGEESEGEDKKITSNPPQKVDITPTNITKVITNTEYVPKTSEPDDVFVDSRYTSTIHNATASKDKGTQFIVTMDGYHPNAFLAKKLKTEGLLDDEEIKEKNKATEKPIEIKKETEKTQSPEKEEPPKDVEITENIKEIQSKKRLSNTSEENDTQVIIKQEEKPSVIEKRKSTEQKDKIEVPPLKKRRASPIIFDVGKKEKVKDTDNKDKDSNRDRDDNKDKDDNKGKDDNKETDKDKEIIRERTISASSDSVILTTSLNSHKYDSLPPLSQTERKPVWCRAFPLCRYGAACAFQHPRCKFAASCTRRACPYHHTTTTTAATTPTTDVPLLASHVVPAANYKSISAVTPSMCKFYPNCVNPACHFYHPKPCRFGKACANKLECNFYHHDLPKWKYTV